MHSNEILDDFGFGQNPFEAFEGEGEVVAKFFSPMEAEVAAARLRSEGIPCFLANTASQNVLTQTMNLVRLHVRPQDRERAIEILEENTPAPESNSGSVATGLLIILGVFLGLGVLLYLAKMFYLGS